jgi:hypothetical protein
MRVGRNLARRLHLPVAMGGIRNSMMSRVSALAARCEHALMQQTVPEVYGHVCEFLAADSELRG